MLLSGNRVNPIKTFTLQLKTELLLNQLIDFNTDVLIAGAGPGGASTSIFLAKEKIPHILIDKAIFPRDKICGDAMSAKTVGMLKRLDSNWQKTFLGDKTKSLLSSGIQFISADNTRLNIPFLQDDLSINPPGFVSKRLDFDKMLAGLVDNNYATFLTGTLLENIKQEPDGLLVTISRNGERKRIFTKMIVGAEGRGSIVAKTMGLQAMDAAHFSAGIRGYYENVSGMHKENFIELHFLKALQPGYLWIFPLANGTANVGVCMLSKSIAAKKVNLKVLMQEALTTHPNIKDRFTNATLSGNIEGWGLPLGSKKRNLSGDRFILTGDAASLIDPFTGEGIGNALVSGLVASRVIKKAVEANNYSAGFLKKYDHDLYQKLWAELRLSHYLQKLTSNPRLFNFVIGKASRSKELRETISCMFENVDIREKFTNPLFYVKILLNR
jgi:geranylgeranyl reductase family protein